MAASADCEFWRCVQTWSHPCNFVLPAGELSSSNEAACSLSGLSLLAATTAMCSRQGECGNPYHKFAAIPPAPSKWTALQHRSCHSPTAPTPHNFRGRTWRVSDCRDPASLVVTLLRR